ncbi:MULTISPECIES: TrbC family F-type conjugative pilus assembly protein [Vibrio]|uniref:Conjugal transfer protein n=2 Tax=Vibrio TaxID=662 RepID=A0A510IEM8_9VIBR|nr:MULTISPECIES: TrbC family F-type conjugative pilus assembly protein [Vibrio]RTZ24620.1 hypothetical protein EKN09_02880 [Vibrio penaeicida]BBL92265.1 hypothetical protein VroAM7_49180 [Vibrio rotiferianus]GLQ71120.1 hypothetical protein GCM10007932_04800 [Vibrio penaeicida]
MPKYILFLVCFFTSFYLSANEPNLEQVSACIVVDGERKCTVGEMELDPSDEKYRKGLEQAAEIISQETRIKEVDSLASSIVKDALPGKNVSPIKAKDVEDLKQFTSFNEPLSKDFWKLAHKAGRLLDKAIVKKQKTGKYGDISGFIFISKSIPKNDLESLIYEVAQSKRRISFVIRGAEPMRYAETLRHFISIDKSIVGRLMVDPTLFNKLNVTEVPTFIIKNSNDEWQRTSGNVSLSAAEEHFKDDKVLKRLGKVYDIEEPDLIALMKERAGKVDWEKWMLEQTKQILTNRYESGLKVASEPQSLLIDPRYQIKKDIVLRGQTFAKQGQWINPLEIQPLSKCYVVADFSNSDHLRAVDKLVEDCSGITALTVNQPDYDNQIPNLVSKYGEIRNIDPLIIKRFKLIEVPVVARQEGLSIRLTTLPPIEEKETIK